MRRIIVPVLVALALLAGAMPGAAQEEPTMSDLDIAGLEKMYGRAFAADMTAMMDPASPEAVLSGWWLLTTLVLEFESEGTASAGVETMREEIASSSAAGDAVVLEEVELDLDDLRYSAQRAENEQGGVTTSMLLVTAQDGRYVYAVVGLTFDENPAPLVESVILSMRDAEVGDDEEMYQQDGTSTGGLWAKLPAVENITSRAKVLTVVADTVYYPAPDSTPAA
jgi:hypothetical protein